MKGFTFVELVVVILLLGVLSMTALARFASPNAFVTASLTQALLQQMRFGAQGALGLSGSVVAQVDQSGDNWQLVVSEDGVEQRRVELAVANSQVLVGATPINAATPLSVTFAADGSVDTAQLGATSLTPENGIELQLTGDSNRTLCLYPTGHISERACS